MFLPKLSFRFSYIFLRGIPPQIAVDEKREKLTSIEKYFFWDAEKSGIGFWCCYGAANPLQLHTEKHTESRHSIGVFPIRVQKMQLFQTSFFIIIFSVFSSLVKK